MKSKNLEIKVFSVLRIRIRRICIFLGHLDPYPDLLVRGTDPDPCQNVTLLFKERIRIRTK
jgi:hypothetical protein